MDILATAFMLFLIIDPIGNVPVFLSILKHVPRERIKRVVLREMLMALVILVGFGFSGNALLELLQLQPEAVSMAGGIVLFIIAVRMIFPAARGQGPQQDIPDEPFLVPLAVPLIAGPSTIATLLLLTGSDPGRGRVWLPALLLAWAASVVILMSSGLFYRLLGPRGLVALERLMGMLLVVIAVQMFLNGVRDFMLHEFR